MSYAADPRAEELQLLRQLMRMGWVGITHASTIMIAMRLHFKAEAIVRFLGREVPTLEILPAGIGALTLDEEFYATRAPRL